MESGVLTMKKSRMSNMNMYIDNRSDYPTQATITAMAETIDDVKNSNRKIYNDSVELMNDLLAD